MNLNVPRVAGIRGRVKLAETASCGNHWLIPLRSVVGGNAGIKVGSTKIVPLERGRNDFVDSAQQYLSLLRNFRAVIK